MQSEQVLGIDLGGTYMRLGLVDEQHHVSAFTVLKTREVLTGARPIERLIACIQDYCSRYAAGQMPAAVSIGFPSTIDRSRRVVISTPNVQGLDDLPVADLLEDALQIPVFVNRDVNFLMLYDLMWHHLEKEQIVLGFYAGTGFGNAIVINGRFLLGKHGMAAELGHIPMYRVRKTCGCGNQGCVETVVSGICLEKLQKEFFPDEPLDELFIRHRESPVLLEFVEDLSLPIATEITIFDPDSIILGGGIFQMPGFPKDHLEECIYRHVRKPYPGRDFAIRYSPPHQENGVIGAGIYAFRRMRDPSYL